MKILVTILSSLTITSTVLAGEIFCFDATAVAAKTAVAQALGADAAKSEIKVSSVSEGSWTNGSNGPYKQAYNTRRASGAAYIGGDRPGGFEKRFEVNVDTKAGTCEVLGAKVKLTDGGVLE